MTHWYVVAKRALWTNLADVRVDFRHADVVGKFTVFNIGGNKYRLVTIMKYRAQIVYIRHILTHIEYDKGKWIVGENFGCGTTGPLVYIIPVIGRPRSILPSRPIQA